MSKQDGGPAFPSIPGGITLRDWFAGVVLPEILPKDIAELWGTNLGRYASTAYQLADAMLAERERGE